MKLEPWYVTGLCDGDGMFTYSRGGALASLYFAIKLTAANRQILERLQEYFEGVGAIYDVKPTSQTANAGLTKRALYYRISHTDDLRVVVAHFDLYPPQGRRSEVYKVWRELYEIRKAWYRRKVPDTEVVKFEELLELLSSLSPRNQPWSSD